MKNYAAATTGILEQLQQPNEFHSIQKLSISSDILYLLRKHNAT